MKIIYLADIHGAFAQIRELLTVTDAQVYIIAGDLIDRPFFTEEMAARYRKLQSIISGLQLRIGDDRADTDEFAEDLLKRTDLPGEILGQAAEYRDATIRARRVLQQKYKILESILFLKETSQIFCLPGNYDMDLQYTSLHGRDLHRHWYHVADLRIAGYGGADVSTPGIPQRYAVPYRADRGGSEMTRFFAETRPDIIVTHKPALGVHDHISPMGESGSPELRRYCEENQVPLCLTGHVHDQWGFEEVGGTIYLNPSNFGEVLQPGGRAAEGGFFYGIETRDRKIAGITLSKLVRGRVYDLASYSFRRGRWIKYVLDPERFGALLRGKNHDRPETSEKDSLRDEMKKAMRWFFPGGGAAEEIRAATEKIKRIASRLEEQGKATAAVDILGDGESADPGDDSVSDLVVYLRLSGAAGNEQERQSGEEHQRIGEMMREALSPFSSVRIVDWIDLDRVLLSIREKNYECDAAQRFAAYRAAGRSVFGDAASAVDSEMDRDPLFRGEIEGTGFAYMQIFQNLAGRVETMKVFEARLRELGITAPGAFKLRIRECFNGRHKIKNQKAD